MERLKEELGEGKSQGVGVMMEKTEDVCRKGNSQKGRKSVKKITLLAARFLKDMLLWFKPLSSTCPNAG